MYIQYIWAANNKFMTSKSRQVLLGLTKFSTVMPGGNLICNENLKVSNSR